MEGFGSVLTVFLDRRSVLNFKKYRENIGRQISNKFQANFRKTQSQESRSKSELQDF